MVAAGAVFDLPQSFLDVMDAMKNALLAAAMFGHGTGVVVSKLVKGAISSVFIAVTAFIAVTLVVQ